MPRTTLDLESSVLRLLRLRGRAEGKSMGQVASELLARELREAPRGDAPPPVKWVSRDLGRPRIDLEDRDALHSALDSDA
jgi:hypothetical protein